MEFFSLQRYQMSLSRLIQHSQDFLIAPIQHFFNVLQLPATHVPMGLTKQGVPIGFEVGAAPNQDNLTIQVVKELSRKFAGWIEPGSYPLKSEG